MKENKLLRVALYIRVSTDKQAKEGDSLEAQENALVDYVKKNNHIIVDKYIDGGESGQKLNRTNLTRLLDDVKKDKIDLILMTKLDRWFRSVGDFYKVQSVLDKHKVKWKTIWEDYDTTTASGEFWLNMSLSLARMEAQRTSERIKAVFDHKYKVQKTVCTGAVPYGYKISKDKKIIIDEEKAQHIRDLYNYYIKTNRLLETVRWFQENCAPKSFGSIKSYLKNPVYIGKYIRKRTSEVIEDYAPPIIEEETFYKVQDLLKKNLKGIPDGTKKELIFAGLIRCSVCGCKMHGIRQKNRKWHYYRCKKAYEGTLCSNRKHTSELQLENYLKENILTLLEKRVIEIKEINSKTEEKKVDVSKLKAKLNKLVELYTNEIIDLDYYKKEYYNINNEIERIEKENKKIKKIDTSKIEKILKSDLFKLYDALNNEEKRKLWSSIIDYIEAKHNNFVIKFLE